MRFATFNILHGRSPADGSVDLDRFAACVRKLDADVLALQEVDKDQPRSHSADLTAVAAEAMGAEHHVFVAAISGTPGATWVAATGREQPGSAAYGIALLSRYPVDSWQSVRLPKIPVRFPLWLPEPQKWIFFREEPRAAAIARVRTPLGPAMVVSTHLSFVPRWNHYQLRRLARDLRAFPDPVVLMGDLNMAGTRPAQLTGYRSLARDATFPAEAPTRQLDHILVRGEFGDPRPGHAVRLDVSDHQALVVDFTDRPQTAEPSGSQIERAGDGDAGPVSQV
jgi:endonuclease/exonuclease/phosphatase family metal-dependent hydrolase